MILSLFLIYYVSLINGCSRPVVKNGTYYISRVQLLDPQQFPFSVSLQIQKVILPDKSEIKCKIMNINNGLVRNDTVDCIDLNNNGLIRNFGEEVNIYTAMVECNYNCDKKSLSVSCKIERDGYTDSFDNIPFSTSNKNLNCNNYVDNNIFTSFTIFRTTYVLFESNMIGFYYNFSIPSFTLINVQPKGDFNVISSSKLMTKKDPIIYLYPKIIQTALGPGTCETYRLSTFKIKDIDDKDSEYDQSFTVKSFEFHGGKVDTVMLRVYHWGIASNIIDVYNHHGLLNQYQPDLRF